MKAWFTLVIPLAASLSASPAFAQLPPEKSEASFKVSPGLELKLWASEPLCINPTSMDIDQKGRVWYCESVNYRVKLRGEKKLRRADGDAIVILEDTKGTGKADKRTIFYQAPDFIAPLGICVAPYPDGKGCKVYVCHSPHIYVFEDKDGDGKADGPPKILLTGFGGYDHDHGVHGISIGPDNKLYFSVGDQGVHGLQSSDKKGRKWTSNNTDCRAGTIWRCDLDGKNLELIAHNFRNPYAPTVDSFGTIFISDNDDDGNDQTRICYVMPGGNYGYHPRGRDQTHWHEEQPGIVPKVLRTFRGSPTGMCFYEGTLLRKKYWGQPLHVDAGPGRLSCYHLKEKGAGYEVDREDMVTSSDSWFRPSDVRVAPDGSVFVCDWYDPGVGGHGIGDLTRGRIYRVAPEGNKSSVPLVDLKSKESLQHALASPNLSVRAMAQGKLSQLTPENTQVLLSAFEQKEDRALRGRSLNFALYLFSPEWMKAKDDGDPKLKALGQIFYQAMAAQDSSFRALFIRAYLNLSPSISGHLMDIFDKDASVAVHREMLLASGRMHHNGAIPTIRTSAPKYDGKDRFYLAAIGIAVGQPGISAEVDRRREIILADFWKRFPEWNDKVAGLVWELRPPGMVENLTKRLKGAKPQAARLQIIDILAGQNDPACGLALVKSLGTEKSKEVREHILVHLKNHLARNWKGLRNSKEIEQVIDKFFQEPGERETAIVLAAATENGKWAAKITAATDRKEPEAVRLAAVRTLGAWEGAGISGTLSEIIGDQKQSERLRSAAIESLSRQKWSWLTVPLLGAVADARNSLEVRRTALAGIAGHKEGGERLLAYFREKKLAADLTPDLSRLLRNSPFPDIKKQAQTVLPAPPRFDPKNLPSIPALLARRGSHVRGEQIIMKTLKNDAACLKCHTIGGTGGNAGPDLSTIGSKAGRQNLLESILYPSRAIADQYTQWIVETSDGKVLSGIIVEETKDRVVLRDVNVKDHEIPAKEIAGKKKSPLSLMPDNLMQFLSEDDLLDIVEYLYGLKNAPLTPTASQR